MKKSFLILFVLCLESTLLLAQLPGPFWKETSQFPTPPSGAGNTAIAVNLVTNSLYVGTANEGVFRSFNQGASWQHVLHLTDTAITKLLVDPAGSIYAIAANSVYRSTDDGTTWERNTVPTTYDITDIERIGTALMVSTAAITEVSEGVDDFKGDGIFVSYDNGKNWVQKNLGITFRKAITHLAVNSYDMVFASMASFDGLGGGLYYSTDLGNSWIRLNQLKFAIPNETINVTSVYQIHSLEVEDNDTLHLSFDGVATNVAVSGNLKIDVTDMMWGMPWKTDLVNRLGFEWQRHPIHSLFFAKHFGHRYSSLHTPNSTSFGGPYFQAGEQQAWARVPSGMLPVQNSYLKTLYAEDKNGRIYATQLSDFRVFYTDTSAVTNTAVTKLSEPILVTVYPNPATDKVMVASPEKNIRSVVVLTIKGEICQRQNTGLVAETEINLEALSPGLYVIQVITDAGVSTRKLIKH